MLNILPYHSKSNSRISHLLKLVIVAFMKSNKFISDIKV